MKEITQNRKQLTRRNTIRLAIWTLSWTATVALVTFGAIYLWDYDTLYSVLAVLLNLTVGAGMILANIRYLKGLDELDQKITMDAMGIALGVTLVGGMAYSMLDTTNIIAGDAEISVLVILMAVTYMTAMVVGKLRYK